MPKQELPIQSLDKFLPAGTFEQVHTYLRTYKVHLTITQKRHSVLGDYRHKSVLQNHRISINGNLNTYGFLITLLHELAHLITFEKYGTRVQAHGKEWKLSYAHLLREFIEKKVFPADIEAELVSSLHNPGATTCAEVGLQRVLRRYDNRSPHIKTVEELPYGSQFIYRNGQVFKKGEKLRKRYLCLEIATGKKYLFSPICEVEPANFS